MKLQEKSLDEITVERCVLKKDKIVFDEIREKEEKEARLKKIAKLIETSGKSLDEIEAYFNTSESHE